MIGAASPAVAHAAPLTEGVRVLVVDDDEDVRLLARRRLERQGYAVEVASSGEEALERLGSATFDLLLLDHRLPGRSGLDLLREVRELQPRPSVVLATGEGSEEVAVEALRLGAVDYLAKGTRFLEALPGVMERAWRTHDLARRADELQRQALAITATRDRATALGSIVQGAHSLLRSVGCALFTVGPSGTSVEARAGAVPSDLSLVEAAAAAVLRAAPAEIPVLPPDVLVVPLRDTAGDAPVGALVVFLPSVRPLEPEELRLADVFASFAAIAISNLTRLALEEEMVTRLQELVTTRRQMLTTVNHELRTPLTCIQGFAATLLTHGSQLPEDVRVQSLEAIVKHTAELRRLVDQLVEVAQTESGGGGALNLRPTDAGATVDATLSLLGPLLSGRAIRRELAPVWVVADDVLLQRVLVNLLTNAVKYSPEGSPITVRSSVEGDWVEIAVVDSGPGLDAHEIARVFEPFWRTSGPLRDQVRGAGVGLALVREYVALMGGRVEARSRPGEGATFAVRLRSAAAPVAAGAQNSRSSSDSMPRSAS
jgi:signal transduction histidine kinase/FixJ family two-component response regulator